jgi:tRNA pseudouridine38-40 synthase
MMRQLKLTVAYDGTDLVGWQRQASGVSVQGLLESALSQIDGAEVHVHGAGRTDAGVHALAQVASARVVNTHDVTTLQRAVNAQLPLAVRVTAVEEAGVDFHARFSATGKTYRYLILQSETASPFLRPYVWHVPRELDVAAMAAAAAAFRGTHDFSAFQSTGGNVSHAIRTVTTSTVSTWTAATPAREQLPIAVPDAATLVVFEVSANGFLRHMVRAMAGTLVEVGDKRRPAASISGVLDGRLRAAAGITAPPSGLWLVSVNYC